jgi:hypothetical protein
VNGVRYGKSGIEIGIGTDIGIEVEIETVPDRVGVDVGESC